MSRNVRAAATALALAGGVYLAGAAPAEASNMGFKLERTFELIRRADGRPIRNIYWLSRPYFDGVGDVANSTATNLNKCVGDPDGPAAGDGAFNADDAICEMWTERLTAVPIGNAGSFSFSYYDRNNCVKVTRNGVIQLGTRVAFTGPPPFLLQPDIGYEIEITHPALPSPTAPTPRNRAVIVGSHDPSFPGRTIQAAPICSTPGQTNCCGATAPRYDLVSLPYHSMWQRSFDILCGLEGVDWVDNTGRGGTGPADGFPDTCWEDDVAQGGDGDYRYDAGEALTGIFDGVHPIAVAYFENTLLNSAPVTQSVQFHPIAGLQFPGPSFDLVPGDAYRILPSHLPGNVHVPTTFLSPHF